MGKHAYPLLAEKHATQRKQENIMAEAKVERKPGVCVPWEEKRNELPDTITNEELVRKVWEDVDALGYMYIWHCLVSF
jgi:hypothetical protein